MAKEKKIMAYQYVLSARGRRKPAHVRVRAATAAAAVVVVTSSTKPEP